MQSQMFTGCDAGILITDVDQRITWHVRGKSVYTVSLGKTLGNRPHGSYGRRWVDDIKIDPKELQLETVDRWALVAMAMNFRGPENTGNFYTNSETISFSRTMFHGVRFG